jgi:4-carboxymuconolactone decarboxylase
LKPIQFGLVVLLAAAACGAFGYFAGRASAQAPQPRLTESQYNATLPRDVYPDSRGRLPLVDREVLDEEGKRDYDRHIGPNRLSLAGLQGPGGLRLHGSKPDRIGEELGSRLKELIRLIVSRELDQSFEWTVHEPVALREKLEPAIIDIVRHRKPLAGVPEKEAAMIQLGREYFQRHKVSLETYARALEALGPKNLVDMCVLMGDYTETAVLLTVNDVHLPYDVPPLLPVP